MRSTVRAHFWVEAGLASLCGFLSVLTLVRRDWIETLTGFDPDHHIGSFEGMILAGLFLVCVLVSLAARAEWRRARPEAAPAS
ncbi:MAG: ABC transporter permease [Pseudomonadota bacterium]